MSAKKILFTVFANQSLLCFARFFLFVFALFRTFYGYCTAELPSKIVVTIAKLNHIFFCLTFLFFDLLICIQLRINDTSVTVVEKAERFFVCEKEKKEQKL